YYYFGKDPALTFGTALPFGLNTRQQEAWQFHGGGMELLNDFLKTYNCWGMPTSNTTCQMGGWFRKEIKSLDDMKGLKFRVGGFAGRIPGEAWRGAAAACGGRHLSGAREGHDRCRRVGRAVRRREARLRQNCEILLLPRLVGGGRATAPSDQSRQVGRPAPDLPGEDTGLRSRGGGVDDEQIRRAQSPGGEAARRRRRRAASVPAAGDGGLLPFGQRDLRRAGAEQRAFQEDAGQPDRVPQRFAGGGAR